MRFGRWNDTTDPGLHYHMPFPIETVLLPKVTRVSQIQLGYRLGDRTERTNHREVPEESRMLTGDENIVEANFAVFWRIKDAGKFLFEVRDPEGTVKVAVESVMRNVVARNTIQAVLSDKREQIAMEATTELQQVLDSYDAGIFIQEVQLQKVDPPAAVIDAFNDVQRAKADQERLRNEAEAYRNDIVPRARGDAQRMIQDAEAYKEQVVDLAEGEAKRFSSVLSAYRLAQDVTARRMYVETMEEIVKTANKVVIDPAASKNGQGVLPYLPLPEIGKKPVPTQNGGAK
jgi:membrane protease subunit HflK